MNLIELLTTLAFDSWSSPEAVTTTITAIITAISGATIAIITALRSYDRKRGKTTCRVTGKKLKPAKTKKENKPASQQ